MTDSSLMSAPARSLTRRSVLWALVGAAATACRPKGGGSAATSPRPGADDTALRAAADVERQLIAAYDGLIASSDAVAAGAMTRARAAHAVHLRALERRLLRRPTVTPTVSVPPASLAAVRAEESASVATLTAAAVTATDGPAAALVASIAASHRVLAGSHDGAHPTPASTVSP